jgi:hypothetical protein
MVGFFYGTWQNVSRWFSPSEVVGKRVRPVSDEYQDPFEKVIGRKEMCHRTVSHV